MLIRKANNALTYDKKLLKSLSGIIYVIEYDQRHKSRILNLRYILKSSIITLVLLRSFKKLSGGVTQLVRAPN